MFTITRGGSLRMFRVYRKDEDSHCCGPSDPVTAFAQTADEAVRLVWEAACSRHREKVAGLPGVFEQHRQIFGRVVPKRERERRLVEPQPHIGLFYAVEGDERDLVF